MWWVQTFLVLLDKVDEHDPLVKKFREKMTFQHFTKCFNPSPARVSIMQFDDFASYENWRKTMLNDKEFDVLRKQFYACIDLSSYHQE